LSLCPVSASVLHRDLHSFPTRLSSDLRRKPIPALVVCERPLLLACNSGGRLRHERYCVCSPRRQLHGVGSQKWEADTLGRITWRSEEHTSELQSRFDLVCRLLLEKKNT